MGGLRILVAEDDPLIAMFLGLVLVEMGHEVCATEFTQAGLVGSAARCKPDLMIVDAGLGEGSGVLAVEEILKGGFVPHVFASGDKLALGRLDAGAVVMAKPFHEAQIALSIQRAMAAGVAPAPSPE